MRMILIIALRNLVQARRRTLLLSSAIGMVTALLVLLLAISQGISDNLVKSATTLSAGHVVVAGFYKPSPSQAIPMVTDAAKVRAVIEASTPNLDHIIARGRGWGKLVGSGGTVQSGLSGVTLADEPGFVGALQLAARSEYIKDGDDKIVGDVSRIDQPTGICVICTVRAAYKPMPPPATMAPMIQGMPAAVTRGPSTVASPTV